MTRARNTANLPDAITVDNSNNRVGINTASLGSISHALQVNGTSGNTIISVGDVSGTTPALYMYTDATNSIANVQTRYSHPLAFGVANAESFRIDTSGYISKAALRAPKELWTVSATAATGTIQFDCLTQGVLYYTTNSSNNWTLNFRGNSGTTLNSLMNTGDAITASFLATNSTAYYQNSAVTVDGAAATIKWSGGTAPSAGNASAIDIYSYTIVKTANATFTVLCAGPVKYA